LAFFGMHLLLTDLGFDLEARRSVIRKLRDSFATEFHIDANFKHQLSAKFRPERTSLQTLIHQGRHADSRLAEGLAILRQRSQRLAPVMAELQARARASELSVPM